MATSYYPQSPARVSKNLTSLTPSYQLRTSLAILAILLFFFLYVGMVVGLGYLFYYAIIYDMGSVNRLTILLKISAIAGAAMLFVFTLKFVFNLKNHKPENRIKLEKDKNPEVWNFIDQICKETGAPKPKSIYVDPDVNAYVSYTNSWLSLFLPVKKELTIGLGLVSCLNLSEFKAVISHEFGHFAQSSMKIGSYIMSANTIIHDMIFSRDKWDNLLDQWRASDIRLSAAAWVITPIIWIIRQVLTLFYQLLNIMHSSLSREMEFNADKVAVSTSGSDAIISALWKLDGGSSNWASTINHAYLAAQKKYYVKNLYTHNILAIDRASDNQKTLLENLPDDIRGGKKFFSSSEISKAGMYASHPPNDKREDSAKVPYIECEEDSRSPWILFGSKELLQEEMSAFIYNKYLNKLPKEYISSEDFESFVKAEKIGNDLLEEYHHTFENRFIYIAKKEELETEAATILQPSYTRLEELKTDLLALVNPVKEIELLMLKAQQISEGTTKENEFSFRGVSYKKYNLQEGYTVLLAQREVLFTDSFKEWDLSFCAFHLALAKRTAKESKLLKLYDQHNALNHIYLRLVKVKNTISEELNNLQSREDVTQQEVNLFGERINNLVLSLDKEMTSLDAIVFVPLPNIENVNELREAIVAGGSFKKETGPMFENGGFNRIYGAIENAVIHCQRIDQKSIGEILSFHKELQKQLN